MVPRVLQSWVAPRRVVRGLSAMPEGTKLAVLMAAMLVFLIAQAPANARLAQIDPAVPFQARMGGAMLAVMFMMPVLAYALALLAVAPAMLLAGLVAGLVGQGPGLTVARAVCGLGFLMIWGAGISALARRV